MVGDCSSAQASKHHANWAKIARTFIVTFLVVATAGSTAIGVKSIFIWLFFVQIYGKTRSQKPILLNYGRIVSKGPMSVLTSGQLFSASVCDIFVAHSFSWLWKHIYILIQLVIYALMMRQENGHFRAISCLWWTFLEAFGRFAIISQCKHSVFIWNLVWTTCRYTGLLSKWCIVKIQLSHLELLSFRFVWLFHGRFLLHMINYVEILFFYNTVKWYWILMHRCHCLRASSELEYVFLEVTSILLLNFCIVKIKELSTLRFYFFHVSERWLYLDVVI